MIALLDGRRHGRSARVDKPVMPELVACPACGCKVQMAETMLGRHVRCPLCSSSFTAAPAAADTPPAPRVLDPVDQPGQPLCPRCGQRVGWEADVCPYCREEFEQESEPTRELRLRVAGVRR